MRVVGERHERVHPGPRRERDDREARGEGEALGVAQHERQPRHAHQGAEQAGDLDDPHRRRRRRREQGQRVEQQPPEAGGGEGEQRPVLDDDGAILRDSMAILVYLATKYDEQRNWLPEDAASAARVMEWLAFAASWIQYGVFTARAIVSFGISGNGLPHTFSGNVEEARLRGNTSLKIIQQQLSRQDWLCGDAPTIADVACFPYIALAPMGDIALAPYPPVRNWIARFKSLSGYLDMPGLENPEYRRSD